MPYQKTSRQKGLAQYTSACKRHAVQVIATDEHERIAALQFLLRIIIRMQKKKRSFLADASI